MKSWLILFSLMSTAGFTADRPNHKFEENLQNTYNELSRSKMSSGEWDMLATERNVDKYEIVPGDNLWDVSKTIFGSGFFWPKLWQLNSSITNPHEIEPGFGLTFIDMGVAAPPVLQADGVDVSSATTQVIAKSELEISEDEILELKWQEPELPEGKKSPRVLTEIPPSFFDWRKRVDALSNSTDASIAKSKIFETKKYYLEHIISLQPFRGEGKVVETELGYTNTAATYDYVFIEVKAAGVGDEFVAMKNAEPITDKNGKIIGYPIEIQAKLKIVETVNAAKHIHKALVLKSFRAVEVGVELIAGDLLSSDWGVEGTYVDVRAKVIGGRFDNTRQILALGSVIFLDKGSLDGLEKGSLMNVLKNSKLRGRKIALEDSPSIGRIKIVHTDENVATGLVVEARAVIRPGDFTGNPVSMQLSQ